MRRRSRRASRRSGRRSAGSIPFAAPACARRTLSVGGVEREAQQAGRGMPGPDPAGQAVRGGGDDQHQQQCRDRQAGHPVVTDRRAAAAGPGGRSALRLAALASSALRRRCSTAPAGSASIVGQPCSGSTPVACGAAVTAAFGLEVDLHPAPDAASGAAGAGVHEEVRPAVMRPDEAGLPSSQRWMTPRRRMLFLLIAINFPDPGGWRRGLPLPWPGFSAASPAARHTSRPPHHRRL